MAKVTKKDLEQSQAADRKRGTLKRQSKTVKNSDGNDITGNLYYIVDNERKAASREYLSTMLPVLKAFKAADTKGYQSLMDITKSFTQLVKAENETENLYKVQRHFGRKTFGTLDYFPTDLEGLLLVISGCYAAVKEMRISDAEIKRQAAAQKREKDTVSNASDETLADVLSLERLEALLKAKKAAIKAAEKKGK